MFSLVLIVLSVAVVYGIRYYLTDQAFTQTQDSSSITVKNIIDTLHEQNSLTDPELLSEAAVNSGITITIADENGKIINSSDGSSHYNLDVTSNIGTVQRLEIENTETHIVYLNTKVTTDGKIRSYLQVVKNMAAEYSFLNVVITTMGIADIAGVLLSLLIGFLISKRMLRPIDKITTTAKEISISDLNRKIEVKGNDDELDRLAKTFNEMIDRLRQSFEQQNNFVADASHELRTPISVVRGYIDLIDRWGKNDPAVLEEAIDAIKNETKDMGDMVERLLFLARSDIGKLIITKEQFNLFELIEELILEYRLIYPERVLRPEIPKDARIFANRKMIKQVMRAVIDNSIKYSPGNSEIRIFSASKRDNEVSISVQDFGIGIPQDKLKGIFERFYRVDSSRERKTGGAGLGLSIVETIVAAHGGRVEVESETGKGTLLTIIIPKQIVS